MKRLLKICLFALLIATGNISGAYGEEFIYDGITYGYFPNSGGYFVVAATQKKLTKDMTSIKIPNKLEYQKDIFKPVREVQHNAFTGCQYITEMVLPDTMWTLNSQAFKDCTNLKTLTLPKTATSIGDYCFYGCVKLKEVTIPGGTSLGNGLFTGCVNLETVRFQEMTAPVYGQYIFRNCTSLTNVIIPPTYKTNIGKQMFQGCTRLKSISIPYSVGIISSSAFQGCTSLKHLNLASQNHTIYDYAFAGCVSLDTVNLPKQMVRLYNSVFEGCTGLKHVTIKENMLRIGNSTFKDCSSLSKITIPAKVNIIEASAFEGCKALDSVTVLNEEPFAFGADAFKGISPTCVLMVPYGKRSAYIAAGWTEEVFKGGVKEIIPAGISQVKVKTKETGWYDLQGRKIAQPEKGHIYISGGKKVMK